MSRRRFLAAAVTLVCALGLMAAPGLGPHRAYAAPQPPSGGPSLPANDHRSPVAPPPVELPPGATLPDRPGTQDDRSLDAVRIRIDTLYQQAGAATDAYNLAGEQSAAQSAEVTQLAQRLVAGQVKIAQLKKQAGAAARAQYRGAGLPPSAQLALTDDPQGFLDGVGKVRRDEKATRTLLNELTSTQADLRTYAADASANWEKLRTTQQNKAKAKKELTSKIADAKRLEAGLEKDERARLEQLEQDAAAQAQTAWLNSAAPGDMDRRASAAGRAALAYATGQLGKPYVWGAEGPDSFDCSGLTSQAWAAAGRPIPRTSQEQWRLLPHIPLSDLRPGDLIIYYKDATHVAMYAGGGQIVQAPRPGRNVTLSGAGAMPILGAVRPDR